MKKEYQKITEEHLKHLEEWQSKDDGEVSIETISTFISDIVESSSEIGDAKEREHLRDITRYWANIIFDHTQEFPAIDLIPGPMKARERRIPTTGILVIGALLVCIPVSVFLFNLIIEIPAARVTETPLPPTLLVTETIAPPPSVTPVVEITPSPTFDPLTGISIQMQNLIDSDIVPPQMTLRGIYSGFEPSRSSIHVLIQPLSTGEGKVFPSNQFFMVTETSGEWMILVHFGDDESLGVSEQYNVRIAFTSENEAREELAEGAEQGFELSNLPRGVNSLLQVVTVERKAYVHLQEERLFYTTVYYYEGFDNHEIVSAKLDGRDIRRLTFTTASELEPALCPGNQKIAFIQRTYLDEEEKANWAVFTVDSDGQNMTQIIDEPDMVYERPVWSDDCRFLAYTAAPVGSKNWLIHLLDLGVLSDEPIMLASGRYQSWVPGLSPMGLVFERAGTFWLLDVETCLELVINDAGACEAIMLTGKRLDGTQPFISPNGRWLAYATAPFMDESVGFYNQEIYIYDLTQGGEPIKLTKHPRRDWYPVWGPDSNTVYFESARGEYLSIWAISIDGSNLRLVSSEFTDDTRPFIAFQDAYLPISTPTPGE